MKLLLTAISGSREGKTFTIEPNECITFGRTGASNWSFEDDGHMSSIHFEVENLGTHAEVRDRGSTNGTWLNNQKVVADKLREGDRLRAGKTVLTVEFLQQPPVKAEIVADTSGTVIRDRSRDDTPTPRPSNPLASSPSNPLASSPSNPLASSSTKKPPERRTAPEPKPAEKPSLPPLAPPPLPSTDRIASPRPINPFDSIDFAAEEPPYASPAEPPQSGNAFPVVDQRHDNQRHDNPISDSSFAFQMPDVADIRQGKSPSGEFSLLERRTSVDAADGISIILDTLSLKWSIQLVLHFQKIRTSPPTTAGIPMFSWLTGQESLAYSPIRIAWNDVNSNKDVLPLIPRLCRADACIAFVSRSSVSLGPQVDQMLNVGLEGFSEAHGFLPICWPSSFATMVDVVGANKCNELFDGKIAGALLCSAWDRSKVVAVADSELALDLTEANFNATDRLNAR